MEKQLLKSKISVKNLNFFYGKHQALFDNNIEIPEKKVMAIIGPSGCGKSTHLRVFNKIYKMYPDQKATGEVLIDGVNILAKNVDATSLRRKVGMIFQKPTPFPLSIFENIAYGIKIHYKLSKTELENKIEEVLKLSALWDEVKDKLNKPAEGLSGGQQQRLCIARALAVNPEIILMDEPTSALDPKGSAKIEELIFELKKRYTVVIVTHNLQQAGRVSDFTAFFYEGKIIEVGKTKNIFTNPQNQLTENYLTGRFG